MERGKCSRYFAISHSIPSSDPACGRLVYQLLKSPADAAGGVMTRTTKFSKFYNFTEARPDTSYWVVASPINSAGFGEDNGITVRTLNENEVVTNGEYIM